MTRDEAKALYHQGEETVVDYLVQFAARLQSLEERLAKNSGNSSKPPSSDGLSKPALKPMPQSLRQKSGKRPGGQKGHSGKTLEQVQNPDQIVTHRPDTCAHCAASFPDDTPSVLFSRRQIFEMPKPQVVVTEHQALTVVCACCGHETRAAFPEGVAQPVQYGPNLLGFATYLHSVHLLPYARCAQIVQEVTSAPFSRGSLANALQTAGDRLGDFEEQLKTAVLAAPLLHVDETGGRVAGKLQWFHVRCTKTLCYLFAHPKRGKEAVTDLLSYTGRLVSDFYSNYVTLDCSHQFCGAHLLRELTFAHEVLKQEWAGTLKAVIEGMVSSCHRARERGASRLWNARALSREFDRWVAEGLKQNPLPTPVPGVTVGKKREARGRVRCLLDRLRDYRDEYLPFLFDLSLPFTNNVAERDVRMLKVKGRVSGCFRTESGASLFCRLRSYVQTCQKQGMSLLDCLRSVFAGNPLLPALSPT